MASSASHPGNPPMRAESLRSPDNFRFRDSDGSSYRETLGIWTDHTQIPETLTDLHASETNLHPDPKDPSRRSASPPRAMLQDSPSYIQEPRDYEDEYHPLPSPTRSSLRSPGKGSSVGSRVTFADGSLLDASTWTPRYRAEPPSTTIHGSFRNSYLTSTPVRKENTGGGHQAETKRPPREESSKERLLRLSSDLFVATHLSDAPSSSVLPSTWRKGFRNISKTYTLPSKPSIINNYTTEAWSEAKAWSPESISRLSPHNTSVTQPGLKRSSSLASLTTHRDPYAGDAMLTSKGVQERGGGLGLQEVYITSVLQQLLDLVDHYWNGSGSLLQNPKFIKPARELLSQLMSARSEPQAPYRLSDRAGDPQSRHRYSTDHNSTEDLKQQLLEVREENHILQDKMCRLDMGEAAGAPTVSLNELTAKYGKLSSQVAILQQQQDTAHLLHQSQRALVSTNEYLLQQLNTNAMSYNHKAPASPSAQCINIDKPFLADAGVTFTSDLRAGACRKPERLSQCPL